MASPPVYLNRQPPLQSDVNPRFKPKRPTPPPFNIVPTASTSTIRNLSTESQTPIRSDNVVEYINIYAKYVYSTTPQLLEEFTAVIGLFRRIIEEDNWTIDAAIKEYKKISPVGSSNYSDDGIALFTFSAQIKKLIQAKKDHPNDPKYRKKIILDIIQCVTPDGLGPLSSNDIDFLNFGPTSRFSLLKLGLWAALLPEDFTAEVMDVFEVCIGRFLREYLGVGDFIDDSGLEPEDIDSCKATFIAPPELVEFAGYALQARIKLLQNELGPVVHVISSSSIAAAALGLIPTKRPYTLPLHIYNTSYQEIRSKIENPQDESLLLQSAFLQQQTTLSAFIHPCSGPRLHIIAEALHVLRSASLPTLTIYPKTWKISRFIEPRKCTVYQQLENSYNILIQYKKSTQIPSFGALLTGVGYEEGWQLSTLKQALIFFTRTKDSYKISPHLLSLVTSPPVFQHVKAVTKEGRIERTVWKIQKRFSAAKQVKKIADVIRDSNDLLNDPEIQAELARLHI